MDKLLADADVFLTNTRTKSLKKMGLDWETLHAKYPKLIMAHGLGYGKRTPKETILVWRNLLHGSWRRIWQ